MVNLLFLIFVMRVILICNCYQVFEVCQIFKRLYYWWLFWMNVVKNWISVRFRPLANYVWNTIWSPSSLYSLICNLPVMTHQSAGLVAWNSIVMIIWNLIAGFTNWPDCISTQRPPKGSHYAKCGKDAGWGITGPTWSRSTSEGVGSRAVHRLN
jgi:hypothetical protein